MGFTKLFDSIVKSSLWAQPNKDLKIVWITMLAVADRNGVVDASIPGLAKSSGVDIESCQECIDLLLSPDEYSRTKDYEGRRIKEVDGGWQILNYLKYRAKLSSYEQNAKRADRRAKKPDSGHFYFISDGNSRVRIGFSRNSWDMLSKAKKKFPKARLMLTVPGIRGGFDDFVKQFDKSKADEHWYHLNGPVEDFIKANPEPQTKSEPEPETGGVPTFEEVIAYGSIIGATESTCKRLFDYYEGGNLWINQYGKLIKWRHKLQTWRDEDRQKEVKYDGKTLIEGSKFLSAEARDKLRKKLAELEDKVLCHPGRRSIATDEEIAKYNEFMSVVEPEIKSLKERLEQ